MKSHKLKTDPEVYDAVAEGRKPFEIRLDDRDFQEGDELLLLKTKYTGAEMKEGKPLEFISGPICKRVTYLLRGPIYGLQEGWVIMGIK